MNYNSGGNRASNFKSAERVESHDQYWDIFLNVQKIQEFHYIICLQLLKKNIAG